MGVFTVTIEVGDPQGENFEAVEVVVDSGASYTSIPSVLLRRLGVSVQQRRPFLLADGRTIQKDVGQTSVRVNGQQLMTVVVFGDDDSTSLLGAVTLEELGLGVDPVARKLIPVPGYLLLAEQRALSEDAARALVEADLAHQIHPQYHVRDHDPPVIFARGDGALLWDIHGNEYIDGLSSLWNVAVGHGRVELAEAAARQMRELAFANSYTGYANVPAIVLAERLMSLVYPNMQAVFFCNSGSEAVEGALKIARFYWHIQGKPEKTTIIARKEAYHGGTLGATTVTGIPAFHQRIGPLAERFARAETCYPYRCSHCKGVDDCNLACADDIERAILREGPDNVAAVIGEPVHGAGGVIPPTPGYWPRVREICDRHDVLLIADEVITGFGRTGRWFALDHWGVQPDIMSVAKAITSAYVPLAGFIVSKRVHDAMLAAPQEAKFMHGYTNAGHPTACAVALRNLDIIEQEGLIQHAAAMGERLRKGLATLAGHPNVGEIRSLGLLAAVELTADKATRAPFDPADNVGPRVLREMRERGVITRVKGDSILLAPPLVTAPEQIDRIVETVGESVRAVTGG